MRLFDPCGIAGDAEILGIGCAEQRYGEDVIAQLIALGPGTDVLEAPTDREGNPLTVLLHGQDEIFADQQACDRCHRLLEDCGPGTRNPIM
jgi:hypothetical protein